MSIKFYSNIQVCVNCKRFVLLFGCIACIFIILILRLTYLQIITSDKLVNEGNARSLRIQNIPVTRGNIIDRRGKLLAISLPVGAIYLDPQEINRYGGISGNICNWIKLSKILSISLEKLSCMIHNYSTGHFLYLVRQLDLVTAQNINQLKLPGVYLRQELKRYYPTAHISAQLIGITNIDNQGIEGIEKTFNDWLTGQPGERVIRKDREGKIIEDCVLKYSRNAQDVVLSIDERLQYIAFNELNKAVSFNKAESGSAVLIDIKTGEILAIVSSPSYDPNDLSNINFSRMRNRAVTDVFEPGSTIKPIVIVAALQHKIINKDSIINTSPYMVDGHQIRDVVNHEKLTIKEILQKSSNVGVSKLALSLPVTVLVNVYSKFGIGCVTNTGLIGENNGKINSCNKYWSNLERATLSYGYGFMITPLQLAKIYAIIGGMGVSRPFSILKVNTPVCEERIFPESLIRTVVDMMENVILPLEKMKDCKSPVKGYRTAIKTGTVKKVGDSGKYINKYIAYTAGIAPVNNPKFALIVIINDPKNGYYYGSMVSTPVFKAIMNSVLRIMNIKPDMCNISEK